MASLITKSDISTVRNISKTVKDVTINMYIDESSILDLQPLLGDSFYSAIVKDPSKFTALLDGAEYKYSGNTITFTGIKTILGIFAYARYVMHGSFTDTPFGYVEKQYNDGANIDRINRKEVYTQNRKTAFAYWDNLKQYLDRNTGTYPLWRHEPNMKSRGITFEFIKNDKYNITKR